ncbi:MAG TPA: EcsC family protein [Thermoleophilaceae bacterium]
MDVGEPGKVPDSLWKRIRGEPERAPEHIALAAAERFAPQAANWVQVAGPGHTPESLASTAMKKHVRLSRLEGAALGVGGFTTAAADLVALGWIQSRMVFYIAAAYGYDPSQPMRPAELLALTGFYETPADARAALDGMGKHLAQAAAERALFGGRERRMYERLLRYVGKRVTRRAAGRLIPFIAAPIGAVQNAAGTKDLGRRTVAYYRRPEAET